VYAGKDIVPQPLGGMGISIVSTSQGIISGRDARARGIGGEVLCEVW
jgi:small subunit ribosomal protein S8